MRIVLSGGTGFLGGALVTRLRQDGHGVTLLTRRPRTPADIPWTPAATSDEVLRALDGADAVINLAGAPIAQRWTRRHKQALWTSRVDLTRALVQAMARTTRGQAVLISGSAVGTYGARGDAILTENSAPGTGFLAELGQAWEHEALAAAPRTRVVLLRTGIALDRHGGALPRMALPFRFFVGGPLGSGQQYVSWIHRDDWVSIVTWALAHPAVSGPLNATAPGPVTNRALAQALGRAMHRPAFMPAPAFALRLLLGEMADAILTGQRVLPDTALRLGFEFRYPDLDEALRAVFG